MHRLLHGETLHLVHSPVTATVILSLDGEADDADALAETHRLVMLNGERR